MAAPKEAWRDKERQILDDPDTYLYQRDTNTHNDRSLLIPFYWGYRAEPGEIKRDENGDPARLRDQFQDIFHNRLDRHFAKGGGFFANATNNLLDMYEEGFAKGCAIWRNRQCTILCTWVRGLIGVILCWPRPGWRCWSAKSPRLTR